MRYVMAGEEYVYAVDFMVDGEFVVPDEDSVSYTIRDAAGTPLAGHTNVPLILDGQSDRGFIEIPASVNEKTAEREPRHVHVMFAVNGKPRTHAGSYILIDFLNHYVTESDVRGWLGVTPSELPDSDIDLVKAYYAVKNDNSLANIDLTATLARGDQTAFAANEAIRMQAALQVLPSLENRIAQVEKADMLTFQRMNKLDINALRRRTAAHYAQAVQSVLGGTPISPILFTVTSPVDPVTGV